MHSRQIPAVLVGLIAVLVVLISIAAWWWFDPLASNRVYNFTHIYGMDMLFWAGMALFVAVMLVAFSASNVIAILLSIVLLLGTIAGAGSYWWSGSWRAHNAYLEQAVVVQEGTLPGEFKVRTPFRMAQERVGSSMGSTIGHSVNTKFLPNVNIYSTIIERPQPWYGFGFYNPGYTTVLEQKYNENGIRTEATQCSFGDDAHLALNAPLWHSLERKVAGLGRTLTVREDDAWGFCDGDTPKVVMPLIKWKGFYTPTMEPAGVAIYDGVTGEVQHRTDIATGELPGPSVGISYSARINNALAAHEATSMGDFKAKRAGLTDEVKDAHEINEDNPTNFSLYNTELGTGYVTPLTFRANAKNITYLGVMDTDGTTSETSGKTRLYKLNPEMDSNSVLADKLRSEFGDIAWASGLRIQEFIPKSNGVWVATIGHTSVFKYRVTITAKDQVGEYTWKIETVEEGGDDESPSGGDNGSAGEGGSVTIDVDLNSMSDEQLSKLINDAVQEIASR